ncbi:unnamed protein product [Moneuplotes crassus]|uniref:Uncharacterized protein n=3 Tax=Euplotes crassus TaxID=5936 RepID=A0AAD1XS62_EUPCR|nr:unnamed protein product [Moneuplotes crassus]
MFRQISCNPPKRYGKGMTINSNPSEKVQLSVKDWQQPLKSNFAYSFYDMSKQSDFQRVKRHRNQSTFGLEHSDTKMMNRTLAKDSFKPFPKETKRTLPTRSKLELNQSSLKFGEDKPDFRSTAYRLHGDPKTMKSKKDPVFKNYNQRVDIITGKLHNQNHRSYGFEGWNEHNQGRISQNKMVLLDQKVINDPITGRKIRT